MNTCFAIDYPLMIGLPNVPIIILSHITRTWIPSGHVLQVVFV